MRQSQAGRPVDSRAVDPPWGLRGVSASLSRSMTSSFCVLSTYYPLLPPRPHRHECFLLAAANDAACTFSGHVICKAAECPRKGGWCEDAACARTASKGGPAKRVLRVQRWGEHAKVGFAEQPPVGKGRSHTRFILCRARMLACNPEPRVAAKTCTPNNPARVRLFSMPIRARAATVANVLPKVVDQRLAHGWVVGCYKPYHPLEARSPALLQLQGAEAGCSVRIAQFVGPCVTRPKRSQPGGSCPSSPRRH